MLCFYSYKSSNKYLYIISIVY